MRAPFNDRLPWIAPLAVIAIAIGFVALHESRNSRRPPIKPVAPNYLDPFLTVADGDAMAREVWIAPSTNAERWDFGGGANTAQNWSNWNGRRAEELHGQPRER